MSLAGKTTLLKTPFNTGSGYGRDGVLMADSLTKLRTDLHLEPRDVSIPLPEEVLYLFARPRPKHFDLAIHHEYPGELGFPVAMPKYADLLVGWTMFEFTNFGPNHEFTEKLAERLSVFDLVLAYDDVSYSSLAEYMPDDLDRLRILQGGYDADFWRPKGEEKEYRNWDDTFKFVMNGTMNRRKNPWAAIQGFKMLKDEHGAAFDAELHLKTTSLIFPPNMEQWCEGLKIHYGYWGPDELRQMYLRAHCLVAPSWGEGKNLPALEAQTAGMPVIVSAFGGHMQWADESWAYLVDGPIEEHSPGMGSIRVSAETMAEKMWHVYNNRAEARLKGERASQIIPAQCDWSSVLRRLEAMLPEIKPRDRNPFKD